MHNKSSREIMQIIDGSRLAGESKLNGKNVVVIHFKVKYIIHL